MFNGYDECIEVEEDDNVYTFSNTTYNKLCRLMCTKCFNSIGTVNMNFYQNCTFTSKDLNNKQLRDLEQFSSIPDTVIMKCPICGKKRKFVFIDSNMFEVIEFLNKNKIYTEFSCEGHSDLRNLYNNGFSVPYISFKNYKDIKIFDMDDPMLEHWEIIKFGIKKKRFGLYVKEDITISDLLYDKHISYLLIYLKDKFK